MRPVNIENLERLLKGIWSGELEHDQRVYFCGTACCLAGWDVALHALEQPRDPNDREEWNEYSISEPYTSPWNWSQEHNNLTDAESRLLFDTRATKSLHKLLLRAFKAGRRLELPTTVDSLIFQYYKNGYWIYPEADYNEDVVLVAKTKEALELFLEFVGVSLPYERKEFTGMKPHYEITIREGI